MQKSRILLKLRAPVTLWSLYVPLSSSDVFCEQCKCQVMSMSVLSCHRVTRPWFDVLPRLPMTARCQLRSEGNIIWSFPKYSTFMVRVLTKLQNRFILIWVNINLIFNMNWNYVNLINIHIKRLSHSVFSINISKWTVKMLDIWRHEIRV